MYASENILVEPKIYTSFIYFFVSDVILYVFRKESNDEAVLSVNNPDQVMVCGQLKDFGFRKGR